ncbi:alpha/beta hydrolase [Mucilaginibacter sp.]|uniref:alpha/beta fold hydrolase n=1 Tax=Mucilaginibacter sp. TaxID=1882438 RepID=UPI00261B7115|nr:alpha/beta hydrolase [Mucilaginibacter sp.]MDB5031354.1 Pimeloyl-ACP methyl ester carboxylesterase [Mucilaginibacter sp.]
MDFVTSKDGTGIAYNKAGSGPALILVDGAFCSKDFGPMPKLAPLLAESFTVFTYDRRARGESGDTPPYTVQKEIDDIQALLNEAGGSAFLFGISSGAVLALKAVAAGLNITQLALYEPPFNIDGKYKEPPAGYVEKLQLMIAEGLKGDAAKYYLTQVIGVPSIIAFILRLTPNWSKMKANAGSLPYDAEIMGDGSMPAKQISAITIPAIAIAGEKSPDMLRKAAHAVAEKLQNGQHRVLKGQTHNVSEKVLAPELIRFFTAQYKVKSHEPL